MTAVILTMTFLITILGAVITGLILRMQEGKLLRQHKDICWQIKYDNVTIFSQDKVRPHLVQTSTLLLVDGTSSRSSESRG